MSKKDFLKLIREKLITKDEKTKQETLKAVKTWLQQEQSKTKDEQQRPMDPEKVLEFFNKAQRKLTAEEFQERNNQILESLKYKK